MGLKELEISWDASVIRNDDLKKRRTSTGASRSRSWMTAGSKAWILEHLGLWLANARPTPRAHSPPGLRPLPVDSFQDSYSQLPAPQEKDYSQAPPAHWDC